MYAVALTSIPPRFSQLPGVIAALAAQRPAPARIVVTLPRRYRRFPGDHPAPKLPGAEIVRPATDPGPAGKLLGALAAMGPVGMPLIYCDDDWHYGPAWAAGFLAAHRTRADTVIAASGYDADRLGLTPGGRQPRGDGAGDGFVDIAQGFSGVLVRPDWLVRLPRRPPASAWPVDDIWLSAEFARAGRAVWKSAGLRRHARPLADPGNLQNARPGGRNRAEANRACARAMRDAFENRA